MSEYGDRIAFSSLMACAPFGTDHSFFHGWFCSSVCESGMVLVVLWIILWMIQQQEQKKTLRDRWLTEIRETASDRIQRVEGLRMLQMHMAKMEVVLSKELTPYLHFRQFQRTCELRKAMMNTFTEQWTKVYPQIMKRPYAADLFWIQRPFLSLKQQTDFLRWHHVPTYPYDDYWKEIKGYLITQKEEMSFITNVGMFVGGHIEDITILLRRGTRSWYIWGSYTSTIRKQ